MAQAKQYEYVDLGLPSGLKWAKCNVGAETETDYGSYFQWGDTVDKSNSDCSWATYKYCNGTEFSMTKYCVDSEYGIFGTVDNKITLDPEDDAARVHMDDDWRMPTEAEVQELMNNTDNEWIDDFNGSGVNGRKFTSKADESKYIFIPASGYRLGSSFRGQCRGGDVWSSSLNTVLPGGALELGFSSGIIYMGDSGRYYGLVVRGVMD